MAKLRRWPALAVDKKIMKFVAPAYALPLAVNGLAMLTGAALFAQVWPWLFIPAAGLHALLTAHVASRVDAEGRAAADSPDARIERVRAELKSGFVAIGLGDGLKALNDLDYEFAQLEPVLARRRASDPMAVAHIPLLAKETYWQGLSALEDALVLARAISAPDRQRLEQETRDLTREIETLKSQTGQEARVQIREERLTSARELLDLMQKQQLRVDQLMFQCDRCGDSLQRARMELAALRADSSEGNVSAVTQTLRATIDNAKEVQAELKGLGA